MKKKSITILPTNIEHPGWIKNSGVCEHHVLTKVIGEPLLWYKNGTLQDPKTMKKELFSYLKSWLTDARNFKC